MATRIRLQRFGRKSRPIFHIVVADSRSKRDGRKIEKLGVYNPNTNPATIDLNFDSALTWVMKGAQPSDTARAILSYKGVMMKKHLLEGVKKGAHTEEQVEDKFNAWLADKDGRISTKAEGLSKADAEAREKALAAEKETNQNRAEAIAAKNAPVVEEAPAEEATEEAEAPAAESTEETAE
jgi:small subunit ribosomal protein S16